MNDETVGFLGASVVVRGRIEGRGELALRGRVEGAVAFEGGLVVEEGAVVLGGVSASRVEVLGEVEGDVVGTELVAIRPGGLVRGDVRTATLAIDDGGALFGGIDMDFGAEPGEAP